MTDVDPGRLVFTPRPAPISPRLRPGHRVALLLEMIDKCHGARASLLQLHAIDTALVDPSANRRLAGDVSEEPTLASVRADPALNRAVDRGVGHGLVYMTEGAIVGLTDAGRAALAAVRAAGLLEGERAVLGQVRGKVTRGQAARAAGTGE